MRLPARAAFSLLFLATGPTAVRAWVAVPAAIARAGFENVATDSTTVAIENRRWRDPVQALAHLRQVAGEPPRVVFRRLGLPVAGIALQRRSEPELATRSLDAGGQLASTVLDTVATRPAASIHVGYPSDPDWVPAPQGMVRPTSHSLDLEIGPVFDYELGRVFEPVLYHLDVQGMLRWNPWPGGLLRAGVVVPGHNDFDFDPEHPDRNLTRPEPIAVDQFLWVPRVALVSASAGMFGDNRWGFSVGAARPVAGGALLFDGQADWTGFVAVSDGGLYSMPSRSTGFAGVTWHAGEDVSVRVRGERFIGGDRGAEIALMRAIGDIDLGVFAQKSAGERVLGVRAALPVPPFVRPTGHRVRVVPIERFHVDYHSRSENVGREVSGVASREEFLRRLDAPTIAARIGRYDRTLAPPPAPAPTWTTMASLGGTTGFINTPWAGVMPDRGVEVGYNAIPARWAYDQRGLHDNQVWYGTMGLFPRVEVSGRVTVFPGLQTFSAEVPDTRLTDTDYSASGRVLLLPPRNAVPGLAAGVDDVKGTRRFHSEYVVAGLPLDIQGMQTRLSLGYAFRALTATHYTLDGVFGAAEVSRSHAPALQLEYDSEKWNVALAVPTRYGFRLRAALLHLQTPSIGAGWYVPLH